MNYDLFSTPNEIVHERLFEIKFDPLNRNVVLRLPYNKELTDKLPSVGASWNKHRGYWAVPHQRASELFSLLANHLIAPKAIEKSSPSQGISSPLKKMGGLTIVDETSGGIFYVGPKQWEQNLQHITTNGGVVKKYRLLAEGA